MIIYLKNSIEQSIIFRHVNCAGHEVIRCDERQSRGI